MAEGGVKGDKDVAVLAEGGTVNQTVEGGAINVVAGDQVYGSQENIHNALEMDTNRPGTATATLAEGEHVNQRFTNSNVNVVAGDLIHGNVTYHIHRGRNYPDDGRMVEQTLFEPDACSSGGYGNLEPPTLCKNRNGGITLSHQKGRNVIGDPKYNSLFVKLKEKLTGQGRANFVRKMNEFSWNNIQGMVTQNYEGLTEPVKEYYPQMKTGFKLFKGDYVPLDGFSAHCKPKSGRYIDFQTCASIVTETRKQPCVIIGEPGSGKTIMMKRLARTFHTADQYEIGQPMLKSFRASTTSKEGINYDMVLHMNIRDIPNTDNGTLAEVIFSPSITGLTKSEAQYGLELILQKKTRIIMFFDGLDQASWEPKCDKRIGPWEIASTATIFGNILAGNLLSDVPITVSSREHAIARLSQNMRPRFIAALVGFTGNDAMALYCEIMGEGAEDDWSLMRMSNPTMHYMCLTPVFLIFYMITRKAYPEDPPDCATRVMVCIIQIFLECENARKIDRNTKMIELLNNLKKMAFQGTKEKRVVFDDEDLKRFNLSYEVISDIIIKVPGLSLLGQNILEGMFRFFFSHTTLQDILSALRVVELDYTEFTQVVDEEFPKPYWSVVRSFTCGILNNKGIGNKITTTILKPISDLEKKCEYLMMHLQQQLLSDGSPENKLETFVALREANALDVLRALAEDLDFSNIPLTPAMINTLCTVLKYIGEVRRLSLVNSGMDEELLNVFVKGTRGLEIKVAFLDIRGNEVWKHCQQWRAIFENMTISECFTDVSSDEENKVDVDEVMQIVKAADGKVGIVHFENQSKFRLTNEQLQILGQVKFGMKGEVLAKGESIGPDKPIVEEQAEEQLQPDSDNEWSTGESHSVTSSSSREAPSQHPTNSSQQFQRVEGDSTGFSEVEQNSARATSSSTSNAVNEGAGSGQSLSLADELDNCSPEVPSEDQNEQVQQIQGIESPTRDVEDISQTQAHSKPATHRRILSSIHDMAKRFGIVKGQCEVHDVHIQTFHEGETLYLECVLWVKETNLSDFKHYVKRPIKPLIKRIRDTDTLYFRFATKTGHEYRIDPKGAEILHGSHFRNSNYATFSYQIIPDPDDIKGDFVDMDYFICVNSEKEHRVPFRIRVVRKKDSASIEKPPTQFHNHNHCDNRSIVARTIAKDNAKVKEEHKDCKSLINCASTSLK